MEVTLQDSLGALLCRARDGRLFSQHSEVLKPAEAVVPLLHLHWPPLLWCLWATALSKTGGERGEERHMVKESVIEPRMKEKQNSAVKWELLARFSLGDG